jgi:PKD repeat protein
MTRALVVIIFGMLLGYHPLSAQENTFHMNIHGWLFDLYTGTTVGHHWVYFRSYNNNAQPQKDSSLTNSSGHYHIDSITCQIGSLNLEVYTYDCHQNKLSYHIFYYEPWKTLNFTLCANPPAFCKASFSWDAAITNPLQVQFTDESLGNVTTWYWDFGDGSTSDISNPIHTYSSPGTYQVILEVMDTVSLPPCVDSDTLYVTVIQVNYYTLAGQIFNGSFPQSDGKAKIYYVENDEYTLLDSSALNENGVYYFYMIPEGDYLVQAVINIAGNEVPEFWPTYYGDTTTWQQSALLSLQSDFFEGDILLNKLNTPPSGPGSINGIAYKEAQGDQDPVPDVEIVLSDEAGNPLDYDFSRGDGGYHFKDLPYGTYYLRAEIPGFSAPYVIVTLDAANPVAEEIKIPTTTLPIGMGENSNPNFSSTLYPNPNHGQANLEIMMNKAGKLNIQVLDILGKTMKSQQFDLGHGQNIIALNLTELSSGTYILNLSSAERGVIRKKFKLIR